MSLAARRTPVADAFQHEALLYSGRHEFLAGTLPFVREGLDGEEAVLAALPRHRLELLRAALGPGSGRVTFVDMEELGRNPARIIASWHEFLAVHAGSRPVRGIGELVWPGRTHDELVECRRQEHLLNLAFAGAAGWRLLCPYDIGRLAADVVGAARRTHPWVTRHDRCTASPSFTGSGAATDPPLSPPPASAVSLAFGPGSVRDVRRLAADLAARAGLGQEQTEDLCLATHEIATNSVNHGGGRGVMRGWLAGRRVVCQVEDTGHIEDPLAGRLPPAPEGLGGRGLWLANRLCDLVQIRSSADGTVVRLHLGH